MPHGPDANFPHVSAQRWSLNNPGNTIYLVAQQGYLESKFWTAFITSPNFEELVQIC